jgi:predicted DNA-binding transcriptional regulator AlpA
LTGRAERSVRRRDPTDGPPPGTVTAPGRPPATPGAAPGTPGDPLLTIEEVTADLRVCSAAFYRWRRQGAEPPAVRLPGGGVRVRRSALTAWLRRLEEDATAEEQTADGQLRRQVLGHQEARQRRRGSGAVPTVRITACCQALWRMGAACSSVESVFDPLADDVVLTEETVQVRVVQDAGAVTSSDRNLSGCAAGVEPQRQSGMPQVIRAGERGGRQCRAEGDLAGGVPDTTIDRFAENAAAGAAEQPAVRAGPEVEQVLAEHADRDGRDGDDADGAIEVVPT